MAPRLHGSSLMSLLATSLFNTVSNARSFVGSTSTISFTQIENPSFIPQNVSTTNVYAAPFFKHNMPMPPALAEAVSEEQSSLLPRTTGRVVSGSNEYYVFPVLLGEPAQTMSMIFDTGSGDFWTWSWEMPASLLSGHEDGSYYDATLSNTQGGQTGETFDLSYGSGTVSGNVWLDFVNITGDNDWIGVYGNPIECAETVGGSLPTLTGVDGIFGLNTWFSDSESPQPQQTWLSFVSMNPPPAGLAAPLFTAAFIYNGQGTMDFGFIDTAKYTGTIAYTPVVPLPQAPNIGSWSFMSTGYAIGSGTFNATALPVFTDSGSNISLLPMSITNKYWAQVTGAFQQVSGDGSNDGSWVYPCNSVLPSFTIGIGSTQFVIPSVGFNFGGISDGSGSGGGKDLCFGGIQAATEGSYLYFGAPMFYGMFIVHDVGNNRMGFATRAKLSNSGPS